MNVGSLFSGIGGIELGFERAGVGHPIWFVERDPYAAAVLAKHWPGVPIYPDVRAIRWEAMERPDIITGGFPCQPHSVAGKRQASQDDRDLWPECLRALQGLKPHWAVFENVPGLLYSEGGRFFARVLADLAQAGYDAEWTDIRASDVGAPHRRERIFIICTRRNVADPDSSREGTNPGATSEAQGEIRGDAQGRLPGGRREILADTHPGQRNEPHRTIRAGWSTSNPGDWWATEPGVGRVAYGVPARVDRIKCLGNAVVPQVAEAIAKKYLKGQ